MGVGVGVVAVGPGGRLPAPTARGVRGGIEGIEGIEGVRGWASWPREMGGSRASAGAAEREGER